MSPARALQASFNDTYLRHLDRRCLPRAAIERTAKTPDEVVSGLPTIWETCAEPR